MVPVTTSHLFLLGLKQPSLSNCPGDERNLHNLLDGLNLVQWRNGPIFGGLSNSWMVFVRETPSINGWELGVPPWLDGNLQNGEATVTNTVDGYSHQWVGKGWPLQTAIEALMGFCGVVVQFLWILRVRFDTSALAPKSSAGPTARTATVQASVI